MSFCISAAPLPCCYFCAFFRLSSVSSSLASPCPFPFFSPFAAVLSPGAELELQLSFCLAPASFAPAATGCGFARICLAWAPHRRHWPCAGPPHLRPSSVAPQTWLLRCIFLALPSDHKGRLAIWRFAGAWYCRQGERRAIEDRQGREGEKGGHEADQVGRGDRLQPAMAF